MSIDLRNGEFYIWEESDECGRIEIYHTDCNDKLFKRFSNIYEDMANKWIETANRILKERTSPVYRFDEFDDRVQNIVNYKING